MALRQMSLVLLGSLLLLKGTPATADQGTWWQALWLTPDQQAQRLAWNGEYAQAAKRFQSPDRIGAALYEAGDYKGAAAVLGRSSSALGAYNRGNAQVFLGEYEAAIGSYELALERQPDWVIAEENLAIAKARRAALAPPDDDAGGTGGMLGADEIVIDNSGRTDSGGTETEIEAGDQNLGEEDMRALWLRRVETRPSDFLAAKFNYQLTRSEQAASEQAPQEPDDE